MTNASQAAFAAADWGTTRLRVWLLDRNGQVLAERRSGEGLLSAQPHRFETILESELAAMGATAGLPVIICGMAGSRQGWVEAPYVTIPASLADIFGASIRVPGVARDVRIVPGLAQRDADAPDVMRGEETQLAGAGELLASGRHIVCMPGTHSKWVLVEDGVVAAFQTMMTGEMFSMFAGQSILAHSIGSDVSVDAADAAFGNAVQAALDEPAGLQTRLFRIRAATLLHGLSRAQAASTLSGLLIGAELAAGLARFGRPATPLILVASGEMATLYRAAFRLADLPVTLVDAEAAVRIGLSSAARHAGLLHGGDSPA